MNWSRPLPDSLLGVTFSEFDLLNLDADDWVVDGDRAFLSLSKDASSSSKAASDAALTIPLNLSFCVSGCHTTPPFPSNTAPPWSFFDSLFSALKKVCTTFQQPSLQDWRGKSSIKYASNCWQLWLKA
mmetsp:Transcript_79301/g.125053  ORF Transcript_79301/g.125053 Transcript_79301/m.125053 type:complete len:128 (+) Transcript_79301:647-1030(+)